jgi:hypothetical protein
VLAILRHILSQQTVFRFGIAWSHHIRFFFPARISLHGHTQPLKREALDEPEALIAALPAPIMRRLCVDREEKRVTRGNETIKKTDSIRTGQLDFDDPNQRRL